MSLYHTNPRLQQAVEFAQAKLFAVRYAHTFPPESPQFRGWLTIADKLQAAAESAQGGMR